MASRRMFSREIIGAARFLRMPATCRLFYYDLGMQADDDGVVEAWSVMRVTGATEDDLRVLVAKGFVKVLNEDLVTYIMDWKRNNLIKKDRYHPSLYKDLLVKFQEMEEGAGGGRPALETGTVRPEDAVVADYLNRINPEASPRCLEMLRYYGREMGAEVCGRVFDIALDEKKTGWSYIHSILRNRHAQGVRSLEDWEKLDRAYAQRKDGGQEGNIFFDMMRGGGESQ